MDLKARVITGLVVASLVMGGASTAVGGIAGRIVAPIGDGAWHSVERTQAAKRLELTRRRPLRDEAVRRIRDIPLECLQDRITGERRSMCKDSLPPAAADSRRLIRLSAKMVVGAH